MHLPPTTGIPPRLSPWLRARQFAVPPSMIAAATAARRAGDWIGACAAAGFDADVDLDAIRRRSGSDLVERLQDDLLHLAPDLLRWHLPRVGPAGHLRPGLTIALARYGHDPGSRFGTAGSMYLVARTPPRWADAGQRVALALWDGSTPDPHPHPRPDRRYRLDLHRHLWDVRRAGEFRIRCGADSSPSPPTSPPPRDLPDGCAVDRWAAEAALVIRAEGRRSGCVRIRLGARGDLVLHSDVADLTAADWVVAPASRQITALPVLPDAATRTLPDLELLRHGAISPDQLHPLVAAALAPGRHPRRESRKMAQDSGFQEVRCRGEVHRIGIADGVLSALDHDRDEVRREQMLASLTGTPLACLQAIDRAHRRPDCLSGVQERLDFGDIDGALAIVERLLGPDAILRNGPLRDAVETTRAQQEIYDAYRAGVIDPVPQSIPGGPRSRGHIGRRQRARPRHATPFEPGVRHPFPFHTP
ncbi:hypothetical protein CA982_07315 [Gordonia lacunae]|uniref:Uncharacterized protein n=2 Tax=Gordonia lacunae TaxID=417102 RepID=A0A243QDE2_9ACTN|nr:hypothetical protein CA982_07315 [Gordonia lacunae]